MQSSIAKAGNIKKNLKYLQIYDKDQILIAVSISLQ